MSATSISVLPYDIHRVIASMLDPLTLDMYRSTGKILRRVLAPRKISIVALNPTLTVTMMYGYNLHCLDVIRRDMSKMYTPRMTTAFRDLCLEHVLKSHEREDRHRRVEKALRELIKALTGVILHTLDHGDYRPLWAYYQLRRISKLYGDDERNVMSLLPPETISRVRQHYDKAKRLFARRYPKGSVLVTMKMRWSKDSLTSTPFTHCGIVPFRHRPCDTKNTMKDLFLPTQKR